jgi:hypothetical protein
MHSTSPKRMVGCLVRWLHHSEALSKVDTGCLVDLVAALVPRIDSRDWKADLKATNPKPPWQIVVG